MSCLAVMGTDQSTRTSKENQSKGWHESSNAHVETAASAVQPARGASGTWRLCLRRFSL